jgi:hypothetical protein
MINIYLKSVQNMPEYHLLPLANATDQFFKLLNFQSLSSYPF